jgi:hypothetical protein
VRSRKSSPQRTASVGAFISAGPRRGIYQRWAKPWELLQETPKWKTYLKAGVSAAELAQYEAAQSDTEAALRLQRAKRLLMGRVGKLSA